jgi:outer membrane protein insertion porin family
MRLVIHIFMLLLLCLPAIAEPEPPATAETKTDEPVPDKIDSEEFLRPSGGQFGIGGDEGFGLGTAIGDPTALYGPTRTPVVLTGTDRESLVDVTGYFIHKFNRNQRFLIEAHLDPKFLGVDASYTVSPTSWEGALSVNTWVAAGSFAPFESDDFPVLVLPDDEPSIQMMGAGVEYVQPFTEDLDVAFGLNYVQYAFSNDLLGGDRYRIDVNGSPLTVSNVAATENYLSFRVNGMFSTLNNRNLPTQGTKIRFGLEQAVDIGASSTSFNQLTTNIAQLIEAPGLIDGDHTLLLNVQAGTTLGNPPPIRAFHLGGPQSVRGYNPGEIASGKSFLQTTVEYRHHLKTFNLFDNEFKARLALFYDYGTVLGTADQLKGFPPSLFDKPGKGYAFGTGLQLASDYGLFRLEAARNAEGNSSVFFTVGERF